MDKIIESIIELMAPDKEVAVLMSGGVDSLTCAFSAMRLGKKVHTYTMKVNGIDSEDSIASREAARIYGWEHTEIDVPVDNIKRDFLRLINDYKCKKKTQVECTFPFLYVYPKIKQKYVLSGIAADGHYGLSKKAMIHYRYPKSKFDAYRKEYFESDNPAGILQQYQLAQENDKEIIAPYLYEHIYAEMITKDWDFFNKPSQKIGIINLYPEFKRLPKNRKHANLQLVAGIPKYFEELLEYPELNTKGRKRVMDLVRDLQPTSQINFLY
jgi:asparagine synthetase B (glutamine-hydrolysing)